MTNELVHALTNLNPEVDVWVYLLGTRGGGTHYCNTTTRLSHFLIPNSMHDYSNSYLCKVHTCVLWLR